MGFAPGRVADPDPCDPLDLESPPPLEEAGAGVADAGVADGGLGDAAAGVIVGDEGVDAAGGVVAGDGTVRADGDEPAAGAAAVVDDLALALEALEAARSVGDVTGPAPDDAAARDGTLAGRDVCDVDVRFVDSAPRLRGVCAALLARDASRVLRAGALPARSSEAGPAPPGAAETSAALDPSSETGETG